MGPCFSQKHINQDALKEQFKKDRDMTENEKQPLYSTMYYIMRKNKDLEIVRIVEAGSDCPILRNQREYDFNVLTPNDMKMLFNFKNVLIIGNGSKQIENLTSHSNPKMIYHFSTEIANKFATKFPIFANKAKRIYEPKIIPLLIFRESQLIGHHENDNNNSSLQIFVHSQKHRNEEIYKILSLHQIYELKDPSDKILHQKLLKQKNHRLLIFHPIEMQPEELVNFFAELISEKYGKNLLNTKIYLRRFFPNVSLFKEAVVANEEKPQEIKKIKIQEKQDLNSEEKFLVYFQKLHKQMGGNKQASSKVERAYNLLVTLLTNITSHKEDETYRKVRKTNKQMTQLLGKHKNGEKLLNEVGFFDKEGFYVNSVDQKYLKVLRTDMDLGYRKYIESLAN